MSFKSLDGAIHRLSGQSNTQDMWTADALAYLNGLYDDLGSGDVTRRPTRRQLAGATFMHQALEESPECFVAIRDSVVLGALGFAIKHNHIGGTTLGTRQAIKGVAFALQFSLAREAYMRNRPVSGVYTGPDAREFHRRIGRHLDARHRGSIEWSVEDCQHILYGVAGRI